MTQYQVWTKEPGEEDFEIQAKDITLVFAALVMESNAKIGLISQLTKTESENPNEYIKVDVC